MASTKRAAGHFAPDGSWISDDSRLGHETRGSEVGLDAPDLPPAPMDLDEGEAGGDGGVMSGGRRSSRQPRETTDQQVLDELDEISFQLRGPGRSAGDEADDPPAEPSTEPPDVPARKVDPTPLESSPYLEERLSIAARSLASLRADLSSLGEKWRHVERTAHVVERELDSAAGEIEFLRNAAPAESRTPRELGSVEPEPQASPAPEELANPVPSESSPFTLFTIRRYNATVAALKARRISLLGWTLSLAIAISAALIAVQVVAQEPIPAIWLAVLPIVWMIPVPFFFLSFFGTQRVLRRNHLDLVGGS